tara:strand:- start:8361 stop:9113 length:753 start_codon:yes stop_codon:yes gene_type:complete
MKIELNIPEKLSDIKLKDYQKFLDIADKNKDNEIFLRQKLLQIFCGMPLDTVDKIKRSDFMEITDSVLSVIQQQPELVHTFVLNDVEYGFIPNLDDMSLGEFVDADSALGETKLLVQLMSVFYRPLKGQKNGKGQYNIVAYNGVVNEELKDMPVDAALSSLVFFYLLSNELLTIIQSCLAKEKRENKTKTKVAKLTLEKVSEKSGVGTYQLKHSLEVTILGLKRLLDNQFMLPYFTLHTSKTNNNQKKTL